MLSLLKIARPAVVLIALAAAGCLKSDETITIFPDGSGKIQLKTTLLGMMAQMARMGVQMGGPGMPGGPGGAPGEPADPFEVLKKNVEGKIYWANLKAQDGPQGEYILSGTCYFEDINSLKRENGEMSFKKNPSGEGYIFEMKGQLPDEIAGGQKEGATLTPEQEQMQKQILEIVKGMMAGFDMKVTVVMPGKVESAEGMKATEGRDAVFSMDEKHLLAIMEKKAEPPKEMKVACGPADPAVIDPEMATFKKELADAKAAAEKEAAEKAAKKATKKGAEEEEEEGEPPAKAKPPEKGEKPPAGGEKPPAGGEKPPAGGGESEGF